MCSFEPHGKVMRFLSEKIHTTKIFLDTGIVNVVLYNDLLNKNGVLCAFFRGGSAFAARVRKDHGARYSNGCLVLFVSF